MDFSGKCVIFVLAKRREPIETGFSPLFSFKNLTYKGYFTSDIAKNTSDINFFCGVCVYFLRQVIAFIADVRRRKVKIYLFSWGVFLTFRGSTQVVATQCTAPCLQGVSKEFVLIAKAME